jgi:thiamine pyrophosphokinase
VLALIIANGAAAPRHILRRLARAADLVIAADGGADVAVRAGIMPGVLVGDMDSVSSDTREYLAATGTEMIVLPVEKDVTDTEFALQLAADRGARQVWLAAAWGGRMDHALGNLLLLLRARWKGVPMHVLDRSTDAALVDGRTTLNAAPGDLVSLVPLSPLVEGVTTQGLRYALSGENLTQGSTRGVSNEVVSLPAAIEQAGPGDLLVIHTRPPRGKGRRPESR